MMNTLLAQAAAASDPNAAGAVEKSQAMADQVMTQRLVVKEIAVARSESEESTQADIEQIFEKN